MSPIRKTALFKSLLSLFPNEPQQEKANELELSLANAAVYTNVNWNTASPDEAMVWDETPQGSIYWQTLNELYKDDVEEEEEEEEE